MAKTEDAISLKSTSWTERKDWILATGCTDLWYFSPERRILLGSMSVVSPRLICSKKTTSCNAMKMEIHHLFKLFLCKMILGKGALTSSSRHFCESVLLPFWRQSPTKADNRQTSKSIGNWVIYNPVPHQSWKDENRVPSSFSCYLFS